MARGVSYANVASTLALVIAIGGGATAVALSGKNSVKSDDIAPGAVRSSDIKASNVKSGDIAAGAVAGGKIKDGTVYSADIAAGAVGAEQQAAVPAAHVIASAFTPAVVGVLDRLDFNDDSTGDAFDPFDMWTPADPDAVTVPVAGMYVAVAEVRWANDATALNHGWRFAQVGGGGQNARQVQVPSRPEGSTSAQQTIQTVSAVMRLEAGDDITVVVGQDNEDDSVISVAEARLMVSWLGPAP